MNKKKKDEAISVHKNGVSPQIEDGHIDVANELVEVLAKTQLSGYESRVLWALWRMTWGYVEKDKKGHIIYKSYKDKKGIEKRQPLKLKKASISTKKWIKLTGLEKGNISRTLKRLCRRNIVIKNDNKYSKITWEFQKHYNHWLSWDFVIRNDNKYIVIKNDNKLLSKMTTPVIKNDNKIITESLQDKALLTTKENSLKKTYIKKEKKPIYIDKNLREEGEEKEIFDYWNSLDIFEHKTFDIFKTDIKGAINCYGFKEVKNTIKNYSLILKGEEYFYSHEHTISGFLDPKNFEKFKDLERAKKNYLIRRVNGETEAVEYERYKPKSVKKETEEERKDRYKKSIKKIGELKRELKEKKGD